MLYAILVALIVLWLLGVSLHIGGGLVHLLLFAGLILFAFDLVGRGRPTA